ncbi:hypothetical protein ACHAWF_005566 [Thalassiosira exigua]
MPHAAKIMPSPRPRAHRGAAGAAIPAPLPSSPPASPRRGIRPRPSALALLVLSAGAAALSASTLAVVASSGPRGRGGERSGSSSGGVPPPPPPRSVAAGSVPRGGGKGKPDAPPPASKVRGGGGPAAASPRRRRIAEEAAARWNLTSPRAADLLALQFDRGDRRFDPRGDFLHFHHITKTGGTTISDVLKRTLGADRILPGSDRSGSFRWQDFPALYADRIAGSGGGGASGIGGANDGARNASSSSDDFFPYVASYAHTRLRPAGGPDSTELARFLDGYFALPGNRKRRVRSLAMLREPTDLRASKHAMAICALNGLVDSFNRERSTEGPERICTPEEGLNVSALVDGVVERGLAKCPGGKKVPGEKLDGLEKKLCNQGPRAIDYCRGPSEFLASNLYQIAMRSLYKGLMGRYDPRQRIDETYYVSIEMYLRRMGMGFDVKRVEEYALVDLGGLDRSITRDAYEGYAGILGEGGEGGRAGTVRAGNVAAEAEPDFLWFGISERMNLSTCLLYEALRANPLPATPRARVMNCPTTSWWTEAHRDEVRRTEPGDYAVWRAANAVLDVRAERMKEELRRGLRRQDGDDDGGGSETVSREKRAWFRAMEKAGCLDV